MASGSAREAENAFAGIGAKQRGRFAVGAEPGLSFDNLIASEARGAQPQRQRVSQGVNADAVSGLFDGGD